jgi:hypothetical protein
MRIAWLLAIALSLPALRVGLFGDDFFQHLALEGGPLKFTLGPASLYDFTGTSPTGQLIAQGYFPWQTHPGMAIRFFRPLSSLSIALDQALFGRAALPAHLVNLAWFVALVAVAIALLRRLLSPGRAGLAVLLYATAGAHAFNIAWVASRHMLIVGVFAGLSIWLHLGAREPKDGERAVHGWAAPLALMTAMLSGEASLGAVAFIASYELFGRSEALRRRLVAAAPAVVLGLGYVVLYGLFGFGSRHSGLYCSPFSQPLAFAKAVAQRLPLFLGELAGAIPSGLSNAVVEARPLLDILGLLVASVVATLLCYASLTSAERRCMRWVALATVVSTIPLLGGSPDGRLLVIPMLGSVALLATAIESNWSTPRRPLRKRVVRVALCGLLLFHLGVGGLIRVGVTEAIVRVCKAQRRLATTTDMSACEPGATGLILTGSDPSVSLYGLASIAFYRPELLRHTPALYVLSLAPHEQRLESRGPRSFTLMVRDLPRRTNVFEQLFTDTAFHAGQIVEFGTLKATVLAVNGGLPTQVHFDVPSHSCLLLLEHQRLVSRPLPQEGQEFSIPYEKGPMGL